LTAYDSKKRFVPDAAPEITCQIEGPAHLIGMDGGNLKDLSLYSNASRKMFSGMLLAMIQADAPGEVKVTFTAEGMEPVEVVLTVE
jgi:beta-galactosidase